MPRVPAEQAEQTRRDILAGALTVFAARGYAATRIADVAAELGMTRGAVYGHFSSKADLFLEVVRLSQDPIYTLLDQANAEAEDPEAGGPLRVLVRGWLVLLCDNPCHRAAFELVMNKTAFVDELAVLYRREKSLPAMSSRLSPAGWTTKAWTTRILRPRTCTPISWESPKVGCLTRVCLA